MCNFYSDRLPYCQNEVNEVDLHYITNIGYVGYWNRTRRVRSSLTLKLEIVYNELPLPLIIPKAETLN